EIYLARDMRIHREKASELVGADLSESALLELLGQNLRDMGWLVNAHDVHVHCDLLATRRGKSVVVELERVSHPRHDAIVGRLARGLLQASSASHGPSAAQPVALVHVPHLSAAMQDRIE